MGELLQLDTHAIKGDFNAPAGQFGQDAGFGKVGGGNGGQGQQAFAHCVAHFVLTQYAEKSSIC